MKNKLLNILITILTVMVTLFIQYKIRPNNSNLITNSLPSFLAAIGTTVFFSLFCGTYRRTIIISLIVNLVHEIQYLIFDKINICVFDLLAIFLGCFLAIIILSWQNNVKLLVFISNEKIKT